MTTIGNTVIGRVIVKNSPQVAISIPKNAPPGAYRVKLWTSAWFDRDPQAEPVYFEYAKQRCGPGASPVIPGDSMVLELNFVPGTQLWVCSETDVILNYAVDKVA